jgi:hypothetical protein
MRNLKYIFLFCSFQYVSAQQTIYPIDNLKNHLFQIHDNYYFKDIDNFYDNFVGTWIYQDANRIIRLRFVKKEHVYYQSFKNYYKDYLVGEVQYIENGTEKINTLYNLNGVYGDMSRYSIYSIAKIHNNWNPKCQECDENVERLSMRYNEISNDDLGLSAYFIMRRFEENGIQKMKLQYGNTNGPNGINRFDPNWEAPSTTLNFKLPYGDYVFVREF